MSVLNRSIPLHTTPAEPSLALTIRWDIATTALLASIPAAALLNGQAPRLVSAALIIHIRNATARAELALVLTRNEQHTIPLTAPLPVSIITDSDTLHIDAGDALHVSLRTSDADPAILYARTSLLTSSLALPGGVYDAPALTSPARSPRD